MKKTAVFFCVIVIISVAVFYFINGESIIIGTWSTSPYDYLVKYGNKDGVIYTEIKTVYLGENGCDGAVLFYIEEDKTANTSLFSIGYFDSKKEQSETLYAHNCSQSYLLEDILAKKIVIDNLSDIMKNNQQLYLFQVNMNTIEKNAPNLAGKEQHFIEFSFDNKLYSVGYFLFEEEST